MTHIDPTLAKAPPRRRQIDYEAIAAKMQDKTGLASASVALVSLFAMLTMATMRILWGGN